MREKEKHIIKLNRYFYNKQAIEETKKDYILNLRIMYWH